MAALQKIRSKGALLIAIIGLGLFAFIAEEFFRSIETTSNVRKQQVGEVYGDELSIQDYQKMVEEASEVAKVQKSMQGQSDNLSDQEMEQIRSYVWENYVRNRIIAHEAEKVGLFVTEAEEQEALRLGRANALRLVQPFFGNQQGGVDVAALQDFLKRKDQLLAQAQQNNPEGVEQIQRIYGIWQYAEKQLRDELLEQKFYIFLQQSSLSNPVIAKLEFDVRTQQSDAEVVAVPYASVTDKEANVTDADLKAVYENYKELFRLPAETRDIKFIDVAVTASPADRAALDNEMAEISAQLSSATDVASVVGRSKTNFPYSNIAMSKKAFESMSDVASALDSLAVGAVKAPYYTAADNTLTTLKLISKVQAPDSVLVRQIFAPAQTPEDSKVLADSILGAIKGGAKFADMAKKYQQQGDSAWITSAQYEGPGLNDDNAKMINAFYQIGAGETQVVETSQGSLVVQVLERRNMITKYNVAVVRRNVDFSKQTYNTELSKLNKFLSENRTIADIEKNAGKNGYVVRTMNNFGSDDLTLQQQIGGMKDIVRWIFDEAEKDDISRLYEVGRNNDHLFVVGVAGINKKGYLPMENESVKQFVTSLATQQKKGEVLAARLKDVKSIAQAKHQKDAVSDTLTAVTFATGAQMPAIGVPEPVLGAAIAKTQAGKFVGPVKGAAAVYMAQVTAKKATEEKFDKDQEMQQLAARHFNYIFSQSYFGTQENLLNALRLEAKEVDRRYQF